MPLHELSDASLVERAVRNARNRSRAPAPRWTAIEDAFGLGSTYSRDLCRLYGLDPDEQLPRGRLHSTD